MNNYITEIDIDRLSSDISMLQQKKDEFKAGLKKLTESIIELNGSWDGPAKSAFDSRTTVDTENLKTAIVEIEKLITALEAARDEYNRCENAVDSIVSSIVI